MLKLIKEDEIKKGFDSIVTVNETLLTDSMDLVIWRPNLRTPSIFHSG